MPCIIRICLCFIFIIVFYEHNFFKKGVKEYAKKHVKEKIYSLMLIEHDVIIRSNLHVEKFH